MASQPSTNAQKVGHGLAKVLGIKLEKPDADPVTRGESTFSTGSGDTFVEHEPSSIDWLAECVPSGRQVLMFIVNIFPFLRWLTRYNVQWFLGDLVAGVTVGAVVVPQGMAYAKLAELPVEFGLYSSFMGVLVYWFFATSKDITIGPVAVVSTLVGHIIVRVRMEHPEFEPHVIASAFGVICGAVVTFVGLIRCGWLVDFIPLTAISAFMTGSALSISSGQVPSMLGITTFNTRDSTYKLIINTLKHLGDTKIDAAMGLSALFILYAVRSGCTYCARKYPSRAKLWFFLATLRTVIVILFYTGVSAGVNIHRRDNPRFRILGTVPRGFQHAAVPDLNPGLLSAFSGDIPAGVIVLLIEHIAISKSFGRINNYTIDPSQELIGIGVTNLLGPFLGGYPATGSFSRTAIQSKAGVRTPFGGVITAMVVLLAIYALPPVFFYIPNSSLSAVIIHAVGDLITPPNTVYQFWRVSPLEVVVFFAGVFVMVFTNIENGIYTTVCMSLAILLFRLVKAQGQFLGRVKVHTVVGDHLADSDGKYNGWGAETGPRSSAFRNIFLPISHADGSNPEIEVGQPYPGVFIYRFSEGFNYPSVNHYLDHLVSTIYKNTRRTNPNSYSRPGDRPWNMPGPRRGQSEEDRSHLPTLKAVILDFSTVNNVDVTSVQNLIDVRNQLDLYASPQPVHWHFAHLNNRWTKRALASAGFGFHTPTANSGATRWKPIFSVANLEGNASAAAHAEFLDNERENGHAVSSKHDIESPATDSATSTIQRAGGVIGAKNSSSVSVIEKELVTATEYAKHRMTVVNGVNRPLFHADLTSALQSAIANAASMT
ncbi:sulfate permease [Coccidioides immitis RS]|uniref:Sulfate permease n=3 Tax=Coccidioides immitis TaxID=5501 RepID=A0A0E1RXD3_COCIM|nr:sulfate permease [Coccidioides immitis RS]EAS33867.1 sulfate permease [Coccidioides immitis RS]KMP05060.1 sulfate permease 2 [Coccidioides immitis RMSCC 2394]KMU90991.1 sulfate permease 2 [Coccidioides immitis H538.4]TPX21480.1 Sulfate permease 2 [Coccidioides immitis]